MRAADTILKASTLRFSLKFEVALTNFGSRWSSKMCGKDSFCSCMETDIISLNTIIVNLLWICSGLVVDLLGLWLNTNNLIQVLATADNTMMQFAMQNDRNNSVKFT